MMGVIYLYIHTYTYTYIHIHENHSFGLETKLAIVPVTRWPKSRIISGHSGVFAKVFSALSVPSVSRALSRRPLLTVNLGYVCLSSTTVILCLWAHCSLYSRKGWV